jgi:phospholipid/cholesterol/gamma-HCH transport system ATP-binding protein
MFQAGALWSSMSVGENVMLPLREYTDLEDEQIETLARFKLALVGWTAPSMPRRPRSPAA